MSTQLDDFELKLVRSFLLLAFTVTLFFNLLLVSGEPRFNELAASFLQGQLDLIGVDPQTNDVVYFNSRVYWPLGPMPAVLLMPSVAFLGDSIHIGHLNLLLISLIVLFVYGLAKKSGYNPTDRLWLIFAFVFATPMLAVLWAPKSYFFSHVLTVFCLFGALYEWTGRKRPLVIGSLISIAFATRMPAAGAAVFFIIVYFSHTPARDIREKLKKIAPFLIPIMITIALLAWYNYSRFGSFFESGYGLQNIPDILTDARDRGVFHISHLLPNVYYFLLEPPRLFIQNSIPRFPFITTTDLGVGLLFSAPFFFSLLWKYVTDRVNLALSAGVIASALPIFFYYGIGLVQFSYRYSLDFLPLLFLIYMRSVYARDKKLHAGFKILFIATFVVNAYLILSAYLLASITLLTVAY